MTQQPSPPQPPGRNWKLIWRSALTAAAVAGGAIGLLFGIVTLIAAVESDGSIILLPAVAVALTLMVVGVFGGVAVGLLPGAALAAVIDRQGLVRQAPVIWGAIGAVVSWVSYQLWLGLSPPDSSALTASILIAACGALGGAVGGLVMRRG